MPRERIVHDIAEADKVCACCDSQLHCIGEDVSEKLEFIPAQVKVIEHLRPKYACQPCEKGGTANQIKQAPMPDAVIPKGYATPSLLAQVITSKYQYGLPLHRQETMFKQLVERYYSDFKANLAGQGKCVPKYFERKSNEFLRCGRLEHGFLRVVCNDYKHEQIVAFSYKWRSFCPSFGARRMAGSVALLIDDVPQGTLFANGC